MNASLTWFRRVVLLGIVVNLGFIGPALFAPDFLLSSMGLPANQAAFPWLANIALLLIQASAFYLPAAFDPQRYVTYAWLGVFCRFGVSMLWLHLWRQPDGAPFRSYFFTDLAFSVIPGVLLQLGLPADLKISATNIGRVLRAIRGRITSCFATPRSRVLGAVAGVLIAVIGLWLYVNLARAKPDVVFKDPAQQFKHGAIGLGFNARTPYWLFKVMPDVCSGLLPGGWPALGLIFEPGQDLSVGFSKREIGFASVEPNCALCHTASYRTSPDGAPQLILGGPAHELDLQGLQRFLYACAADPRFTADNVLSQIAKLTELSLNDRLVYRLLLVPFTKQALHRQAAEYAWQNSRPTQGKGRTDTFNPTKMNVFHMPDDGSIGTTDLPATWNQRPREGLWLHWDGNNNAIRERNYAAAMAIGATPRSVLTDSFKIVTDFLLDLPAPRFPFPVDPLKAERGQPLWQQHCAACHDFGTLEVGQVTPIAEVATDGHRLNSFTAALVERFHQIDDPPFVFDAYRKTGGYSNLPIDGCWARAPYLHNGAVPTLWDLLQTPDKRTRVFYRGYNVYDPAKLGYVCEGPEAEKVGFRYDTSVAGNGNGGHLYGTDLTDEQKWDLIEYLKTN